MAVIVKASQRSHGQELARHLQNAADNESVVFHSLRGSVSDDLAGAFAEWKMQASVTRCTKELYSVSINPQERWPREWYEEFLDQMEKDLGLENQPRAVVFHTKKNRDHCHAVFSRVIVDQGKAVHLAFDHDQLKMTAKRFAREKGLTLPAGYHREKRDHEGKEQLLLHEKMRADSTGITREMRQEVITDIWRRSDSPQAFLAGLQDHGYMVCKGKRPLCVVDYYGGVDALPRMITDKRVRTADIRTYLSKAVDVDALPTVDEMRGLIAQHRQREEQFQSTQAQQERREQIVRLHAERQASLQQELAALQQQHEKALDALRAKHIGLRASRRSEYLQAKRDRVEARDPPGHRLTELLQKATGLSTLKYRFQRYQDGRALQAHQNEQLRLRSQQDELERHLKIEQELLEYRVKQRIAAVKRLEQEELRSVGRETLREHRDRQNHSSAHSPALDFVLSPYKYRKVDTERAKNKFSASLSRSTQDAAGEEKPPKAKSTCVDKGENVSSSQARQMEVRRLPSDRDRDGGKQR